MTALAYAAALAGLAVPLAWMIPISEACGWNQCLKGSGLVALTLFSYYGVWGYAVSLARQRISGARGIGWDTLWYVNLPLTLVYLYRATNWSAPFTCS